MNSQLENRSSRGLAICRPISALFHGVIFLSCSTQNSACKPLLASCRRRNLIDLQAACQKCFIRSLVYRAQTE